MGLGDPPFACLLGSLACRRGPLDGGSGGGNRRLSGSIGVSPNSFDPLRPGNIAKDLGDAVIFVFDTLEVDTVVENSEYLIAATRVAKVAGEAAIRAAIPAIAPIAVELIAAGIPLAIVGGTLYALHESNESYEWSGLTNEEKDAAKDGEYCRLADEFDETTKPGSVFAMAGAGPYGFLDCPEAAPSIVARPLPSYFAAPLPPTADVPMPPLRATPRESPPEWFAAPLPPGLAVPLPDVHPVTKPSPPSYFAFPPPPGTGPVPLPPEPTRGPRVGAEEALARQERSDWGKTIAGKLWYNTNVLGLDPGEALIRSGAVSYDGAPNGVPITPDQLQTHSHVEPRPAPALPAGAWIGNPGIPPTL